MKLGKRYPFLAFVLAAMAKHEPHYLRRIRPRIIRALWGHE